jgi:hypothetical protein
MKIEFFEQIAGTGLPNAEDAEVKLDLSGMEKSDALVRLDSMVQHCKKTSAASLYVGFNPARQGGGETLFQPVARYFKIEKMNGYVRNVTPIMTPENAGVFVVFKL